MRLTAKIVSVLVLEIIILLGLDAWLSVQRTLEQFDVEMEQDARLLGAAIKGPFAEKWRDKGQQEAIAMIDQLNRAEHQLRVRWVWLDAEATGRFRPDAPWKELESVRRGQPFFLKRKDDVPTGRAYTYVPVTVDRSRPGALELSEPLSVQADHTRSTVTKVAILTLELIVVSGGLGLLMGVWLIGRPLNRLIDKTRRIGSGDLKGRLTLRGRDELSELAVALNDMCDELAVAQERVRSETEARIATMEQMRHMDRLRTVGRLAAGIAHELGTPLNVISGRADLVATGRLPPPEVEKSAKVIKDQSERMTRIIRQLLDFARRRTPNKLRVDLSEYVRRTLEMLAPLARRSNANLTATGVDSPVMSNIDAGQIEQVLVNLVVNGLQAMPEGGTLEVELLPDGPRPQGAESSGTEFVCFKVKDEGEGIRPEDMANLFDPFFTTKEVGEGTGLGLSIAYGIVCEHGGFIEAESEPGKGSCFSVFLPKED